MGSLDYLYQQLLAGCECIGYRAVLVDVGLQFLLGEQRQVLLVIQQLLYKGGIRGKLRAKIQIMEESVLLVAYIDEGGIQPWHKLLDFCQIDVANGVGNVTRLLLQGRQGACPRARLLTPRSVGRLQ